MDAGKLFLVVLLLSPVLSGCTVVSSDEPEWAWPVSYQAEGKNSGAKFG